MQRPGKSASGTAKGFWRRARGSRLLSTLAAAPHVLFAAPLLRPVLRKYRGADLAKAAKHLRYARQIARATHLARQLGLHRGPRLRILDLGSGPSYFPFVCRRMGHEVVALDAGWIPLYNDVSAALGVPRVLHEIRAYEPLPALGGPFDLVTAMMICFNGHKGQRQALWGVAEWAWFVEQMRAAAAPSASRAVLVFNRERSGVAIAPALLTWFVQQGAEIRGGGIRVDLPLSPCPTRPSGDPREPLPAVAAT